MKKLLLLLLVFPMCFHAQEKLSKEEKARREKNIKAGNPFAKYGCKAPVATLSKGKYLEVHDLDSIVTIGTSRWDVDNKKIVGNIKIDKSNIDAQPIGDAPGMWMSPDPLSEEFSSWSPYNMCFDNPLKFKDPDGRAANDIIVRGKNVLTGAMEPSVVVKTNLIDVTVDVPNLPVIPTRDPVTGNTRSEPTVISGVDEKIKPLVETLGNVQAIQVSFGAGIAAGGGISGGSSIAAFVQGKDKGGVFAYSTDGPSPTIGLGVGGGVEVGAVFAASSTASNFNSNTLTGPSINLSGGYGPINGTVSMGVQAFYNPVPTSFTATVGTGFSSFKSGATASFTNTILQSTLVKPIRR